METSVRDCRVAPTCPTSCLEGGSGQRASCGLLTCRRRDGGAQGRASQRPLRRSHPVPPGAAHRFPTCPHSQQRHLEGQITGGERPTLLHFALTTL